MKTSRTLFLTLSLLAGSCLSQANDIEPGKEFYTAIPAPNPIVLDGNLDEWTGAPVLADPRFSVPKGSGDDGELVIFEEHQGGNWSGPDDHTSAVQVVYDAENVYFGFVVTDDYHENSRDSAWNGDSIQLMIADETREAQVALYNYALGGVEDALGDVIVMHEAGPGETEAVVVRNGETKRTIYEIKLPKAALDIEDDLTGGVQFGLGMAINDGDDGEGQDGQKGWSGLGAHSIVFGKTPGETALVTLANPPVELEPINDIEPGKEFYTAIKTVNPIVLDGELDEWTGAQVLADPLFSVPKESGSDPDVVGELVNFEVHQGGVWNGPDDHTSAVRVVYDDDNVYFGFVVTDDYHENSRESAWNGDSVQLMIANAEKDTQIALYNYALGGVEEALGEVIVMHEAGPGGTEAKVKRDIETKRTTYEIKLPKDALELDDLIGGTQFGLGMAINDGDDGDGQDGQKGWGGLGAHSIVFGKSPFETALVTLATANDIEAGKEHYAASRPRGEIVLDGILDDWEGVPVLSDPKFALPKGSGSRGGGELVLFEEHQGGIWEDADDHTSAVQIAYDEDSVYFAFVVTDDYHENSRESAWNGDSVQLMIASDKQDEQIALYNYALGGVEDALGEVIVMHEAGPGGTEAVVTRNSETKRTIYEIKLPKESLDLPNLDRGTMFGLGMAINDGDEAEGQDGQKGWGGLGAHSIVFGKTAGETALITLNKGVETDCPMFLSAFKTPDDFDQVNISFRGNDFEGCDVDPASTRLFLDGQQVELKASEKNLGATDFSYTLPTPWETGTEHSFTIELVALDGSVLTESGIITAPIFGVLTPDMKATQVNRTKPGFIWRVFQNDIFTPNDLDSLELALAGELVDGNGDPVDENFADKELIGPAMGEGIIAGPKENLLEFEIPGVINLSTVEGGFSGNFEPDDQMPGVPGINFTSPGTDAEIITYIEFPEGFVTLGVNSDDAFRMDGGFIDQPENRERLGEFPRGRGAGDSIFLIEVKEAGIYPIRAIYQNGGGEGSIEIFSVADDGTKVLVNDLENGGLKAYRSAGPDTFNIVEIQFDAEDNLILTWNSRVGVEYAIDSSPVLGAPPAEWQEFDDGIPSGGTSTQATIDADSLGGLTEDGRIYFRVREL